MQENLVADICKVDKSAYTRLVKASASRVFAICFATVGNRADAEDIAQQAFLKGYSEIGHLRDSQQFEPWIARIAKNLCIDFLRRENRKTNGLYEVADGSNSPLLRHWLAIYAKSTISTLPLLSISAGLKAPCKS